MTARLSDEALRFFAKVQKTPICWLWTAGLSNSGYGIFGTRTSSGESTTTTAHRWSYTFHICPVPEGLAIDHLCRVRRCVNPFHLEPVSNAENMARAGYARALLADRKQVIDPYGPGFLEIFRGAPHWMAAA